MTKNQDITVTVDPARFESVVAQLEFGDTDAPEPDDVNAFIQQAIAHGVFVIPDHGKPVAYYLSDQDPGFIFGLRPPTMPANEYPTSVTGLFVETRDLYSDVWTAATWRELAENVAFEYSALLPTFRKAFTDALDVATITYDWMSGLGFAVANAPDVITGPFGTHGVTYDLDEDSEPYARIGFVLPEGVYAEIEDGTYGELQALRICLGTEE